MVRDDIETIAANSFRNFHAKGLDYLCIQRAPQVTVKAYFYDRPDDAGPEVVCPHDHRYPFATTILSGASGHLRYSQFSGRDRQGIDFNRFDWRTPLNGGSGFRYRKRERLWVAQEERYFPGNTYFCQPEEIHTIRIYQPGTVLLLHQFADVMDVNSPTSTFVPGDSREPPSLDGLYDRMSEDYAATLLEIVEDLLA